MQQLGALTMETYYDCKKKENEGSMQNLFFKCLQSLFSPCSITISVAALSELHKYWVKQLSNSNCIILWTLKMNNTEKKKWKERKKEEKERKENFKDYSPLKDQKQRNNFLRKWVQIVVGKPFGELSLSFLTLGLPYFLEDMDKIMSYLVLVTVM